METKQIAAEDALYEQALSSLRQLNQEVFLNDLETKLKQTIMMIQQEVDDLKAKLEDDQLYLSSTIQNLKQVVHSDSTEATQRVEALDGQVRAYFRDFYGHFTTEIEQLRGALEASVTSTEQLIASYVDKSEEQMRVLQMQQVDLLEHVDVRFVTLERLYDSWLLTLNEVKADFAKQATTFHDANEEQRRLLQIGQDGVSSQVSALDATIHSLEQQQERLRETTKQEFLQAIADSNASRLAWEQVVEEEMTARVASEATMRQQLLDDVNASSEAALTELKEANEALAMRYDAQQKQNRLLFIGLAVLGTAQIVLQLI